MATQDAQGNIIFTPEEEEAYKAANSDVAAAIDAGTITASQHYNIFGWKEPRAGIPEGLPSNIQPETPSSDFVTKAYFDEGIANLPTGSVDRSVSISQTGPEIDYGRIQGFVGVPEIRDEEGNITQQATGIYAQQPQLPTGLMASQEATQQAIGQAAVDPDTGEVIQPATLFEGQSALGAGQAQLGTQLGAGQAGLMAGQQTLGEGQATLGQAIGVPDEQQPATLFGGQMALGQGQAGIQTGVTGLGKDLSSLTGNLSDFQTAQKAYQAQAEGQRAQGREIGMTTRDQLEDQLRTVGSQTNRIAEQQAQQRRLGMMGPPPQAQQPPVMPQAQQATQAAQIAGQNLRSFAPQGGGMMGPTGPVAVDPRDQVGFGPTRSPV
tara:strand:+ start:969 stop:2105 length:1137 start_codon:yes stop_codon:yes gene_type:complete